MLQQVSMNRPATVTAVAILAVSVATAGLARADQGKVIEVRQINTAPRVIGCSREIESCEGASSIRTGLVVIDVGSQHFRRGPVSLVAMFQASAQPEHALLDSQVMFGGGPHLALGRSWVQAGLAIAGSQLAPGPKTIAATSVMMHPHPAVLAGVGTQIAPFEVPLQISLDLGTSLGMVDDRFGDIYQITANLLATNL
jgi:hypothetical protein